MAISLHSVRMYLDYSEFRINPYPIIDIDFTR